jgi:hypothetical protein
MAAAAKMLELETDDSRRLEGLEICELELSSELRVSLAERRALAGLATPNPHKSDYPRAGF